MIQPSRRRVARLSASFALAFSVLLPGAVPAAAADPVVIQVGTTQDLDATNPFNTELVVRLRGLPAHLQPAHRVRQGRQARARVRRHVGAVARQGDVPHPRRHAVVRRHPGDGEGRLLLVGPRDGRDQGRLLHRLRLPRPGRQGRRRDQDRVPRRLDVHRLHDRPVRPHLPGLRPDPARSTSTASSTTRRSPTRSSTGPSSAPGRTPSPSGRPASSRASSATRTSGASRASRTRWCCASSPTTPTPWSRRSSRASSTTRTTSTPTSSSSCRADPTYTAVVGKARTAGRQLAFNTYGTGTGKTIKNGGPSTKALLDPAFRDALGYAVDHKALVDRVLGGFGDVGTTIVPPVLGDLARRARPPPRPSTSSSPSRSSTPPATTSTRTASGSTRKASRSRCSLVYPSTSDTYSKSAQFVKEWYGQLGIDVTDPELRQRHASARWSCRPRRTRPAPRSTTSSCGAGRATPIPNGLLHHLPLRPDRHRVGQPVLQPGLRQALRPAVEAVRRGAAGDPRARCRT